MAQHTGQRSQAATISRQDSAVTAAFPAGYGAEKIDAFKVPPSMNQGTRLITTLQTLGTLAHSKGTAGGAFAAAEIETGTPHVFVPVSTTSEDPYRIKQDYLMAIDPADYFKEVTDDKSEDDNSPPSDLRARID